jgi:hypothetical protein
MPRAQVLLYQSIINFILILLRSLEASATEWVFTSFD